MEPVAARTIICTERELAGRRIGLGARWRPTDLILPRASRALLANRSSLLRCQGRGRPHRVPAASISMTPRRPRSPDRCSGGNNSALSRRFSARRGEFADGYCSNGRRASPSCRNIYYVYQDSRILSKAWRLGARQDLASAHLDPLCRHRHLEAPTARIILLENAASRQLPQASVKLLFGDADGGRQVA